MTGRFPRFADLPLELQDLVWEHAAPPPSPTAYHVDMRLESRETWKPGFGWDASPGAAPYIHLDLCRPADTDRAQTGPALAALQKTCTRSSAAAARLSKTQEEAGLFRLHGLPLDDSAGGPPPEIQMDAGLDLAILQPGWEEPCRWFGIAPWVKIGQRNLRNVAFQLPRRSVSGRLHGSYALTDLLAMWLDRRNFYVVVEPDEILAARGPWAPPASRSWIRPPGCPVDELSLEDYLAACDEQDRRLAGTAPTFRSGTREYYELSSQQVGQSGGLEDAVQLLETARVWCLSLQGKDVRCRVMTWRDSQG